VKQTAPMVTGLDALFLEVNNLEESLLFYRDRLGFDLESHDSDAEPPIATVRAGSLKINLVQQVETMLKRGRGVHLVLGVHDVDALFAQVSAGDSPIQPPRDEGWGGRFISVLDPDGYRLVFVEWTTTNGA
jgi:catechol 2,3-dioxygenase-like lactoylglutathione lyase family enzyme